MPIHSESSFESEREHWRQLTPAVRAALDGWDARRFLAWTSRPGDRLLYRTAPPAWEIRSGSVTAVMRGADGEPVVILDSAVAVLAQELETPRFAGWYWIPGDTVEVELGGAARLGPVAVARYDTSRQMAGFRLAHAGDRRLRGGWSGAQLRGAA